MGPSPELGREPAARGLTDLWAEGAPTATATARAATAALELL